MAEKDFEPLTSQLGIAGTSYRLQLGLINEKWAARILKGKNVMDSHIFENIEGDRPNGNHIVGYVLGTVAIPNINPAQVMKTTQFLLKEAVVNKEKRKVVAPIEEAKGVELEKVPESELKRPKAAGWVKEDEGPIEIIDEKSDREKFIEKTKAKVKAKDQAATAEKEEPKKIKIERDLPKIPKAEVEEVKKEESTGKVFCPFCGFHVKHCPSCGKEFNDYNN